jgi:Raf kinase inhibitor-like YbhB/YbcL family protein
MYRIIVMLNNYPELIVESKDFTNEDTIHIKHTHKGDEISPEFFLKNLSPIGKSIAIIFDDLDQPMNHWIIWNIPPIGIIPGNLPEDKILPNLGNAKQRSRYRGPNPPKGITHKYQFSIYILDCELLININSNKKQLLKAMEGHILQYGFINCYYE